MAFIQRFWGAVSRSIPDGLIGWRYLFPGDNPLIRRHRTFWLLSRNHLPFFPWLILQAWLWLRWVAYGAWRESWWAVRHFGPDVADREGLSLWTQWWRTLALALTWCIPPEDVYYFGLIRRPVMALDYVYDHETAAYHRWCSIPLGLTESSLNLLRDKSALAEKLSAEGIPMVSTLAKIPRGAADSLESRMLVSIPRVFCKSRFGSRGEGAFSVWRTESGLMGRCLNGTALPDSAAVEAAWRNLTATDEALIQPCLTNHAALAPLAHGEEAITLRYISCRREGALGCLNASLEVPVGFSPAQGHPVYVILPIDALTGHVRARPAEMLVQEAGRGRAAQVFDQLSGAGHLPYWQELTSASRKAHEHFPDVWAIAWDWVLTPQGPCLLEGNSSWGTGVPQLLLGGFLESKPRRFT